MSEILLYKANECIGKLSQAQDGVTREIERLDISKENCLNQVNNTFQQIVDLIEVRKRDMIMAITDICNEKSKVLEEQHSLINSEKMKVGTRFFKIIKLLSFSKEKPVTNIFLKIQQFDLHFDHGQENVFKRFQQLFKIKTRDLEDIGHIFFEIIRLNKYNFEITQQFLVTRCDLFILF